MKDGELLGLDSERQQSFGAEQVLCVPGRGAYRADRGTSAARLRAGLRSFLARHEFALGVKRRFNVTLPSSPAVDESPLPLLWTN
ncbi:hypothetical protein SKAU_G00139030, partial [Synaphobranchus kaupii]